MLKKIIETITSWFESRSYGSELEQFIISRNPQNNAHVEALEREYDQSRSRQTYIWGRGF
jgi:hypothetical protein